MHRVRKGPETVEAVPADQGGPPPRVRPGDPAAAAVRAALASGLHWLRANDPAARAGDVEGVHHLRTTTRRAGRALRPADADEAYHEVRKRAKRARYAAETVRDALEPGAADDAGRFARRARKVQDVLGEHQDAVVAAAEVRAAAEAHPGLGPF